MAKGSDFERTICRTLSLWWDRTRDDLLWRTGGSGGRGTVRGRKGKKTAGGCGDICAMDPSIKPLLDLITWEIKRGYNRATLTDLLDCAPHRKEPTWLQWIKQAEQSALDAGSYAWAIVARRDQRLAVIVIPDNLHKHWSYGKQLPAQMSLAFSDKKKRRVVHAIPFEAFLAASDPKYVRMLAENKRGLQ